MKTIIKVHKKGIIIIPKGIREKAGIVEGMLLEVSLEKDRVVLKPLNLWNKVWGYARGLGSAEEAELELDVEEELFWKKRLRK